MKFVLLLFIAIVIAKHQVKMPCEIECKKQNALCKSTPSCALELQQCLSNPSEFDSCIATKSEQLQQVQTCFKTCQNNEETYKNNIKALSEKKQRKEKRLPCEYTCKPLLKGCLADQECSTSFQSYLNSENIQTVNENFLATTNCYTSCFESDQIRANEFKQEQLTKIANDKIKLQVKSCQSNFMNCHRDLESMDQKSIEFQNCMNQTPLLQQSYLCAMQLQDHFNFDVVKHEIEQKELREQEKNQAKANKESLKQQEKERKAQSKQERKNKNKEQIETNVA